MNVSFRVFRFDPDRDQDHRLDTFKVPVRPAMTVLDGLLHILDYQDHTLSLRFACREGVCGSCAMFVNGSYRLACQTQIADLRTSVVTVYPLPHFPILKDLVVDMDGFLGKIEKIMPYLKDAGAPPEKEKVQTQGERQRINEVVDCILCGACTSACPASWTNREFLGPAALAKAYRFVGDSRDDADRERIELVSGEDGVWRCHSVFNCVEACPKNINQTEVIGKLKRKALAQKLKFWQR